MKYLTLPTCFALGCMLMVISGCSSQPVKTEPLPEKYLGQNTQLRPEPPLLEPAEKAVLLGSRLDAQGNLVNELGQRIDADGNIMIFALKPPTATRSFNTDDSVLNTVRVSPSAYKSSGDALQPLSIRIVHFNYDSSDVEDENIDMLKAHASYLKQNSTAMVRLNGHTDQRGTREYNMALGENRAKAVQDYFILAGVSAQQLEVISFGKEKPYNDEMTEEAWAENRRVEIIYDAEDPNLSR